MPPVMFAAPGKTSSPGALSLLHVIRVPVTRLAHFLQRAS